VPLEPAEERSSSGLSAGRIVQGLHAGASAA